jgi:outer membrane immunogenic protein
MRTLPTAFLALTIAVGLAPAALAADLGGAPRGSVKDEPYFAPPVTWSWNGFYYGVHAGYGWSDIDWQEGGLNGSHDGSGGTLGGQIGYNWQTGRLVYGIEGDLSAAWIDGGTGCCDHSVNWLASIRGRLGLAVNDNRTLLYATAGGAWADIDYNGLASFSDTHSGWVVGGGIEHMLTPHMSVRAEYLYYALDDTTAPAGSLGVGPTNLDPNIQTLRVGLNFKF